MNKEVRIDDDDSFLLEYKNIRLDMENTRLP